MIKSIILLVGVVGLSSCNSGGKVAERVHYFCPTVFGVVDGNSENAKINKDTIAITHPRGDVLEMPVANCFKVTKAE